MQVVHSGSVASFDGSETSERSESSVAALTQMAKADPAERRAAAAEDRHWREAQAHHSGILGWYRDARADHRQIREDATLRMQPPDFQADKAVTAAIHRLEGVTSRVKAINKYSKLPRAAAARLATALSAKGKPPGTHLLRNETCLSMRH